MHVLIEGPHWAGQWTEIVADTLQQLGHTTRVLYHNRKTTNDRLVLLGATFTGGSREQAWAMRFRKQLLQAAGNQRFDLLVSIQGKTDDAVIDALRKNSPHMKVVCWWGDILTEKGDKWIHGAAALADRVLVSAQGTFDKLHPELHDKLVLFPFGVSDRYHRVTGITAADRKRFSADVAFVGSYYPERGELVRYLNERLERPVAVWGRGWRHCKGVRGKGALSLADSLKVHALSRISLNLHHANTDNGCNMKFFEIPAAGGFQLCDAQPCMASMAHGSATITGNSHAEFAERIAYFLAHEDERKALAARAHAAATGSERYVDRFARLLSGLGQVIRHGSRPSPG